MTWSLDWKKRRNLLLARKSFAASLRLPAQTTTNSYGSTIKRAVKHNTTLWYMFFLIHPFAFAT